MKRSIGNNNATMGPRFGFLLKILCCFLLPSTTTGQSCIDDFQDIYNRENFVTDTTFPRLYIVCPRKIYDVGNLDFSGNLIRPPATFVNPPLPLRANMTIRCGDQGTRDNRCWVRGGDLHVDGTKILGIMDDTVENVVLEGFTFIGAREHALLANKPGSITFSDCEFRDFKQSAVPVMLDYYDANNPSKELVTKFVDCDFRDNRYFGMGSQSALIYGNSDQNRIEIENTIFENNDMVYNNTRPDTHSYIVESLGPVNMIKSCFLNNLVGSSDVVVFGSSFNNQMNFVSNSTGGLCPFLSVFETTAQFKAFTPTCVEATNPGCDRFITASPTTSPSASPTSSPTLSPTNSPTTSPTISSQPSVSPISPTQLPSGSPTVKIDFNWDEIINETPNSSVSAAPLSLSVNAMAVLLWGAGMYCFL